MRRAIPLFIALLLVVAACSSSGDEDTTTTLEGSATESTVDGESGDDGETNGDVAELAADGMCRTLALFSAARVPPQLAAESMMFVDLDGATSQEMSAYGDLLIGAPTLQCPEHLRYAEAIQYWLGF